MYEYECVCMSMSVYVYFYVCIDLRRLWLYGVFFKIFTYRGRRHTRIYTTRRLVLITPTVHRCIYEYVCMSMYEYVWVCISTYKYVYRSMQYVYMCVYLLLFTPFFPVFTGLLSPVKDCLAFLLFTLALCCAFDDATVLAPPALLLVLSFELALLPPLLPPCRMRCQ